MRTVVFSSNSSKLLDALPPEVNQAVENALSKLAISGIGDVKKLSTRKETFRLRVGRYRVFFKQTHQIIYFFHVGKRETTTYS
jgi:mRNA interferase RelE/StbE